MNMTTSILGDVRTSQRNGLCQGRKNAPNSKYFWVDFLDRSGGKSFHSSVKCFYILDSSAL